MGVGVDRKVLKFLKKCGHEYELIKARDHYLVHIAGKRITIGSNSTKTGAYPSRVVIEQIQKAIGR